MEKISLFRYRIKLMFKIDRKQTFSQREEQILSFWQRQEIFTKSLQQREGKPLFSFFDGPPFATGLPHYGHLLAGTIKDTILRYKTMQGFYVPRRFGWDCHGLPVENEIEKAKELSGAQAIEKFGIAQFNEECRSIVLRYTKEWEQTVHRMGRWIDFAHTYRTMDVSFMESVWWVFSEVYKKGLIYQGFKVMPFSAKLGTPLSNFEANLNYRDVDDPSLTVLFPIEGRPNVSLLAWTTTPWTLPSNLALTVHPDLSYVEVRDRETDKSYILTEGRLSQYFDDSSRYEVVKTYRGNELAGLSYEPLFSYFSDKKELNAFRVLTDEFVGDEEGTGIVHTAPAFGEDDFFVCAKADIEPVCPIDQNGKFTKEVPDYQGQFVKDADKQIIRDLKAKERVLKHETIRHRYPFCWRSDTPLIYKAVSTWFLAVEKIKDRLLNSNEQINWVPEHLKKGRFGKWLENARDWAISRNRFWGTPIPIWQSEDGETIVISSREELEKKTGNKIDDLHRHYIDDLTFEENGKTFKRIPEVFDCWFESGSMPYAQDHYPFEKKELDTFPADFIAEGLDQTRGWFYTLNVLSTALFDKPAFRNVIVNGIILAEDGAKMSKRLKNYPEPTRVIDLYGADAIRLFLLSSPAVSADDLKFSERGVELSLRQFLLPLWNAHVFLSTYAEIYRWTPTQSPPTALIDRWILSRLQHLIESVTKHLDTYNLAPAIDPLITFIDELTNWYIRRSRSRFWTEQDTPDRQSAFATLYTVLKTLSSITAPFIPFLSEAIYQQIRTEEDLQSVHLTDFPTPNSSLRDLILEQEMALAKTAVSLGHSLRKENKIKVRQPLPQAHIVSANIEPLQKQEELIKEELNVKKISFSSDESAFVSLIGKPNFRVLGKKVGKLMNELHAKVRALPQEELSKLLSGNSITIDLNGQLLELTPDEISVERKVQQDLLALTEEGVTVALSTELTEELLLEGLAREVINKINTMRRDEGYEVTDRIALTIETTPRVRECFALFDQLIINEVLAEDVTFAPNSGTEWDLNGEFARILLAKMG